MEGVNEEQLIKDGEDVVKRLKELEESKEWKENGKKPCDMYKMEINGRVASKGIAVVNFNI